MELDRPEGVPPDNGRLTKNQFVLLAHVFLRGQKDGATVPVIWSPKSFMGGSLTRAEASTVSTRLKTLIQRGFIKRYGRELFITEEGEHALRAYAGKEEGGDEIAYAVSALLDLLQAVKERKALDTVFRVMRLREMPSGDRSIVLEQVRKALSDTLRKETDIHARITEVVGKYDISEEDMN